MKNLIKSIVYEVVRSKLLIIVYSAMAVLMFVLGIINSKDISASGMYVQDASLTYTFPLFVIAAVVGIVICPDYRDKVSNYEILSGHSRSSVYFARTLCAVIPAAFMAYLLTFLPLRSGIIVRGWGDRLIFSDVLLRQLLFIFPFIRIASFTACLAFVFKSEYILMALGVVYSFGSLFLTSIYTDVSSSVYTGFYNLNYLMSYDKWSIYNISPTEGIVRYASATGSVNITMVIATVAVSLLMTLVYLFIGYAMFKKTEMN